MFITAAAAAAAELIPASAAAGLSYHGTRVSDISPPPRHAHFSLPPMGTPPPSRCKRILSRYEGLMRNVCQTCQNNVLECGNCTAWSVTALT